MKTKSHTTHRHHVRIIVSILAQKSGRFLFLEEQKRVRRFCEPVGHVEPHEEIATAACREFLEETGYRVSLQKLVGIYHNLYANPMVSDSLRVVFLGKILPGAAQKKEKNIRLSWVDRRDLHRILPKLTHPTSRQAVRDLLSGQGAPLRLLRAMRLEKKQTAANTL